MKSIFVVKIIILSRTCDVSMTWSHLWQVSWSNDGIQRDYYGCEKLEIFLLHVKGYNVGVWGMDGCIWLQPSVSTERVSLAYLVNYPNTFLPPPPLHLCHLLPPELTFWWELLWCKQRSENLKMCNIVLRLAHSQCSMIKATPVYNHPRKTRGTFLSRVSISDSLRMSVSTHPVSDNSSENPLLLVHSLSLFN